MQKLIVEFWKANLRHIHSKNYFVKCFYANDIVFMQNASERTGLFNKTSWFSCVNKTGRNAGAATH